ncbi:MAG: ATP-binding protein [Deltaproteobacteria bacterium]|nr:ATP-binding protein [Deltaproteobacteria bacterium]
MDNYIKRIIQLPKTINNSVFVWGARKAGKSCWIKHEFPDAWVLDLLESDNFIQYSAQPWKLREQIDALGKNPPLIVIDEIQKVPILLDEVHWLIENRKVRFLLTGSSARKLRAVHANLLAGRAVRRELRPFCFAELGDFDLEKVFVSGLLPPHYLSNNPIELIRSYVADYLNEEIVSFSASENLAAFNAFLKHAGIMNGELINYTAWGSDSGISAKVVRRYLEILENTLLGLRLQPWAKAKQRRLSSSEKFYLFDVGVANYLSRRKPAAGTFEFGKSFEHLIFMELKAYQAYRSPDLELFFWRTANAQEVDFIIEDKTLAIEVKSSANITAKDIKGLSVLADDGPIGKRILVAREKLSRFVKDRHGTIEILPWKEFLTKLWAGEYSALIG